MLDGDWLDTVLMKLTLTYPGRFPPKGTPTEVCRAEWSRDLSGLSADELRHGMANLGQHPPNAFQFKAICESRPKPLPLPEPAAKYVPKPEEVAQAKTAVAAFNAQKGVIDPLRWARNLRQREAKGEGLTPWQKQCWRDALAREMAAERLAEEASNVQG